MGKLINPDDVKIVILSDEKGLENPKKFHIKAMTYTTSLKFQDDFVYDKDQGKFVMKSLTPEKAMELFVHQVIKVENISFDNESEPQTYDDKTNIEKVFHMLNEKDGMELMRFIRMEGSLDEEETKN